MKKVKGANTDKDLRSIAEALILKEDIVNEGKLEKLNWNLNTLKRNILIFTILHLKAI